MKSRPSFAKFTILMAFIACPYVDDKLLCSSINFLLNDVSLFYPNFLYMVNQQQIEKIEAF
jgi:hypothetical protein